MAKKKRVLTGRLVGLVALRKKAGFHQSDLAARLRIDETTVSHWERGKSAPAGTRLFELAEILGCSIDELFGKAA